MVTTSGFGRRQLLAGGAAVMALGNSRMAAAAGMGGQCVFGVTQEAVNFNPLLYVNTGVETSVEYIVFDAPWQIGPDGKFFPNLAAEMPTQANGGISADGRTWTIRLRPGVTWHDGKPFTSADVAFTLQTIMNPKVTVRSRNGHEHVASFDTPDDHTIRIQLKDDFAPYMVSWQKTSIIPKHILDGVADINTAPFNTAPIGTGPFKFKERVAGSYISFEPNANYHRGTPKLSSLVQKYVARPADAVCAVPDRRGRYLRPAGHPSAALQPRQEASRQPHPAQPVALRRIHLLQLRQAAVQGQSGAQGDLYGDRQEADGSTPSTTACRSPRSAICRRTTGPTTRTSRTRATTRRRRPRCWMPRAGRSGPTACAPRMASGSPSPCPPRPATSRASRRSSSFSRT